MNAPTDPSTCPKCGSALPEIDGLCPQCLARSALDRGTGWLLESRSHPTQSADVTCVDGWKIIGTLGAGGMGRVYQAESETDRTAAAIKVLDARWSSDPAMVARFQNEARLLQQLDHPNIVRLIEMTEAEDGRLCLVTELVPGCDLARLLRAEKLGQQRAMEIFDKVCAAVKHAHEHGLIHRDIKPSNILVGREGEVKLADFGLARAADEDEAASVIGGLTATTDQFGTAYYLAPERMTGDAHAEVTMDVFSLGVLLYHLLTGQMPLGHYQLISQLTGLPKELDAIIAGALEANPAHRIKDVATLHQRVTRLWKDHSAGTLRAKKLRRIFGIAAGIALLAGTAVAGAWWQHERMRPKPIVYPDPARATQEQPFENSLGMKFVPVPGTKVLFCLHETRRKDAQSFLNEAALWMDVPWVDDEQSRKLEAFNRSLINLRTDDGRWTNFSFHDPGWPVTPDHPVIFVSAYHSLRMCAWLTWKEQKEGRLKPHQSYRLPTTKEWLLACGGVEAKRRAGNVAGTEAATLPWPESLPTFGFDDGFARTAPVGSFPAELHGLYDISGNVSEWVNDHQGGPHDLTPAMARRFIHLRGPAFHVGTDSSTSFNYVHPALPGSRLPYAGCRMVLELEVPEKK